jgi:hypothetical protein
MLITIGNACERNTMMDGCYVINWLKRGVLLVKSEGPLTGNFSGNRQTNIK